jgi:hypothetical protein
MSDQVKFADVISDASGKIMEMLLAEGETTSWDIKMKLHLSSSMLYLALGHLLSQNKIILSPQDLTYRVTLPPACPKTSRRDVGAEAGGGVKILPLQ